MNVSLALQACVISGHQVNIRDKYFRMTGPISYAYDGDDSIYRITDGKSECIFYVHDVYEFIVGDDPEIILKHDDE
jgi:hypothetical protein